MAEANVEKIHPRRVSSIKIKRPPRKPFQPKVATHAVERSRRRGFAPRGQQAARIQQPRCAEATVARVAACCPYDLLSLPLLEGSLYQL